MITIEITNLDELVKEHRGPLTAMLGKIVADVEGEQSLQNMLQDGAPLNAKHWLGNLLCQVSHAGALSGGKNDGFHGRAGRSDTTAKIQ